MHALRLERYQPFVRGALRRRRTWPSRQACYEHFRDKPLFRQWPESGLRAYVQAATRPRADGMLELIYPPEWEARLFATTPTDIWRDVPQLRLPVLFVRGERSIAFRLECQERIARLLPGAQFAVIPGAGHLVTLERPDKTGAVIGEFLGRQRRI
jgi:pimeloyl-ACP methyl ester carboxylesterase